MLTLPFMMRVTLVIAFFTAPILTSALPANCCDEPQPYDVFYSDYELPGREDAPSEFGQQWPNLPEDETVPLRAESKSYSEVFALHKETKRWRATIALAAGLEWFGIKSFDSTLQALKILTNRSALNPTSVKPIWLESPTEEVRGWPVLS